jgi:membrane-bound serine protease (ClpP class)
MTSSVTMLILLLACGLLLVGAEIFVPGAVLGTIGVIALLSAVVVAFGISGTLGMEVAVGVVLLLGITVVLWIKLFPRSSIGKKMTLSQDGRDFKSSETRPDLAGAEGEALSDLRPAGFALLAGRRVDVVSDGGLIAKGARVRVVKVEGSRVVVARMP